jgi:hypothetical protein
MMGGRDLQDEVDGSKYLTKEFGSTPSALHVRGSYGGFMTLMALFTEPKYFRCRRGAAPGDGLGALQSRLHGSHSQFPGAGHAVVSPVVTDLLRRQARGSAPYLAWDDRHQRSTYEVYSVRIDPAL